MFKHFFKKEDNTLTTFEKVVLCDLACTYGAFLNRRSELKKMNKCDIDINQRYYESYCSLLGATKVLGLRIDIDYNARFIDFIKVDSDVNVLSVPISQLVYERFAASEVVMEKSNKNTEVKED